MNRLKKWELALMIGIVCALVVGNWLNREQQALSQRIIRLHVIANSDSSQDQELKGMVRDRILSTVEQWYPAGMTRDQAFQTLADHLPDLRQAAQNVIAEQNRSQTVRVYLETCRFPTKEYDGFALPAGKYTALRVVLGRGQGQNWWCVAFPPLCLGASSESVTEAAALGQLTEEQAALMTREGEGYILKFKILELWDQVQARLTHEESS